MTIAGHPSQTRKSPLPFAVSRPQPQFCPFTAFIPVSTPNVSPPRNSSLMAQLNIWDWHLMKKSKGELRESGCARGGSTGKEGTLGKVWAHQDAKMSLPASYRKSKHVPGMRLEGPAEAKSLSTAPMLGVGALGFFLGVCSRPDESRRGEFCISFTCNSIH